MKQLAALFLLAVTTGAAAAVPIEQAVEVCRAEANALRRLSCYDSIAISSAYSSPVSTDNKPVIHESHPAVMQPAPTQTSATNNKDAESTFGIEHKKSSEQITDKISMTVKEISKTIHNKLVVAFTNDQVWQQTSAEYYPIKLGEQHYIQRGALGAFYLKNDQNNRSTRVKREQ
ncbi:hypothetical protein E0Z06_00525 [Rheinheimera sp. D18]|uniref:hypothetical protein n=1 Tax=Rheinheimera sp. D18 TaxID=2545632 RepID=UPI00104714AD|nr:hypothetical protein [Rheinheimera sp. D18]QBL08100.1 hypothetical protein E0Z06_00525 [Rheinheimera sp. D18]